MRRYGAEPARPMGRRWWAAAAGGAALLVAVTACSSLPDGVDGNLTGDWGEFPPPSGFVPEAGVCHEEPFRSTAPLSDYRPVDCDEPHLMQTIYVGEFPDDEDEDEDGDAAGLPEPGSSELREAYRECEDQAEDLLGSDFRYGRLWLGVATPSDAGWEGGARWFRCELLEVESVYGEPVERQGSLAGALADDPAESLLGLGCFAVEQEDGAVEEMIPVACDEPHDAEFVGVWEASGSGYPDFADEEAESEVYEGCRERVAEYVDVPVDGDLVFRTGAIADWMSEVDWAAGDRSFRCYLWLPGEELTQSLEGAGTDALPVRTE